MTERLTRRVTCELLARVKEGEFDAYDVLRDALNHMSSADVEEFVEANEYFNIEPPKCSECGCDVEDEDSLCDDCAREQDEDAE